MNINPNNMNIRQPELLGLQETYAGDYELSQSIWNAAESLSSPHRDIRSTGLDFIEQSDAASYLPLIAYLLSTRITDPDLQFRARVVKILAKTMHPDNLNEEVHEDVRQLLYNSLSQMQEQQVCALLEVVEFDVSLHPVVPVLLNQCSYAGQYLANLLSRRRISLDIQKLALEYIGQIGYLDALPILKRLEKRLKTKIEDTHLTNMVREKGFLSDIQKTIESLIAP
jgi:DNA-binding protein Fis